MSAARLQPAPTVLAVAVLLSALAAGSLAACASPSGSAGPAAPPATEASQAAPTRASSDLEQPQAPAKHQPVLTTAAAGSGFVTTTTAAPGIVCLNFAWDTSVGAPALPDGVTFVVRKVKAEPSSWTWSKTGCPGDRVGCIGDALSPADPLCQVALVRRDGPTATGATGSAASLVGDLVCVPPASEAQCSAAADALRGATAAALPLDDAIVQDPASDGTDDGTGADGGDPGASSPPSASADGSGGD